MKLTLIILCFIVFFGCDESLPPRLEPQDIFNGTIEPEYILTAQENAVRVRFYVTNNFDETLEAKANLSGYVEIVSMRNSSIRYYTKLSADNLISSPSYDPQTRILRIGPKEKISLTTTWNFFTSDSIDLRDEFFNLQNDPSCDFRQIAKKEEFKINGDLQIYGNLSPVIFNENIFSICYQSTWVRQGLCSPINCN